MTTLTIQAHIKLRIDHELDRWERDRARVQELAQVWPLVAAWYHHNRGDVLQALLMAQADDAPRNASRRRRDGTWVVIHEPQIYRLAVKAMRDEYGGGS